MLHSLFAGWMQFVHDTGYFGVFIMMAIESTVFPLPSEVVVPPAAYWASQGAFSFWGVVIASTLGSWFGSAASYLVARRLGRPLILKYGRFFFLPEKKWLLAEEWIQRYSTVGVFFARLLPVVRHLVSLPAGAARMKFVPFTLSTLLGSFVWSWVLARFGQEVLGSDPRLLTDPDALIHVLKAKLMWLVIGVVVMLVAYIGVDLLGRRWRSEHGRG
ncbi:MAG: DedA family protein [Candidatus Eisenbacteria bacterium]|nr:DedA family protein [Candidatus Eisenbacteria bacterium]